MEDNQKKKISREMWDLVKFIKHILNRFFIEGYI